MTNGESNGRTRGYNLAARTGRMCGDEPHARSGGAKPRLNMVIALAVLFLCVTAFSQTQSQTRDQLLQDIGSGQLKEAIVLGSKQFRGGRATHSSATTWVWPTSKRAI